MKPAIDVGSYKAVITADGLAGSKTVSFKINPAKNAKMTVMNENDLVNKGVAFKPAGATPHVKIRAEIKEGITRNLVPGRDYKVSYSKNKEAGSDAVAKITFLGNYKGAGAITQKFKINKADLSRAEIIVAGGFLRGAKDGSKLYFAQPDKRLFVTIGGAAIKKNEYTVTYRQNGTVLTGKENLTFNNGKAEITVEITPSPKAKSLGGKPRTVTYTVKDAGQDVSKLKLSVVQTGGTKSANVGYTGAEIRFSQNDKKRQGDIVVKGKIGKTVVELNPKEVEEYFDILYVNNINKGKATIILTAKDGNAKGYVGSIIGNFTIKSHELQ